MSLVIGTDSYVTVQQATGYINAHYVSDDAQRGAWETLIESDKEVYLRKATQELERLQYLGVKRSIGQPLSFPRCYDVNARYNGSGEVVSGDIYRYPAAEDVPEAVQNAEIEEALELASPTEDSEKREDITGSVKAYTIGHLSETFRDADSSGANTALASTAAQGYIAPFVGGGYCVR